jgi:transcriptional regulator with XRE-family HTH domain
MPSRLPTHVRRHRRAWALTQEELATLLGMRDATVSQYEQLVRVPGQKALVGLQFIFSTPAHDLFPAFGLPVIRAVRDNAVLMREALRAKTDRASSRKRRLLDDLITRSATLLSSYD